MWTKVVNIFSIITQVIIEILALSLAENGVIFHHNHLWWGDYLAGGQILKMAVSRFVDVSKEKMVSQQILTTVMTRIVVDKSTDHAKPHSICFLPHYESQDLSRFVDNWKHRLWLESARAALCKWATCTRQTFLSKTFANSLNMQKQ